MIRQGILIILALTLILQGCSAKEKEDISDTANNTDKQQSTEVTDNTGSTEITQAAEATQTPQVTQAAVATIAPPVELILPVTVNDTGKVLIQTVSKSRAYAYNSYIITSINGESVVVDPTEMPLQKIVDINPVAILNTHSHPDHIDAVFSKTYDVPKLSYERGDIKTDDFHIFSIPSSHSGDTISEDGKNVIIVFEVDGLRIAHMGDIGQSALTEDQLKELGNIDIAFMQFENSYSSMTLDNAKGFTMIEQLKPKIIIPTHYTKAAIPVLEEKYGTITDFDNILEISLEDLPETNLNVYRILNTHKYN